MDSNFLISLGLVFSSSVAGSFHCGAMCGSFACLVSQNKNCSKNRIKNPTYYHFGRLITYVALSSFFYLGVSRISKITDTFSFRIAILSCCVLILLIDLVTEFPSITKFIRNYLPQPKFTNSKYLVMLLSKFNKVLGNVTLKQNFSNSPYSSLTLGLTTGLIPCSWLYIYLAMAGTETSLLKSNLLIFSFWLGTIPILVIIGKFGSLLASSIFPRIKYVSRTLLICAAIVSINMRSPFLNTEKKSACGMCASKEATQK